MSSLYADRFDGSKAVDGRYEPVGVHEQTSIAITKKEPNPWIMVDLGEAYCISAVKIWNRYKSTEGITNVILQRQSIKYIEIYCC